MKEPEQIVDAVESECQNSFGPNIKRVLTALVRFLDQRYKMSDEDSYTDPEDSALRSGTGRGLIRTLFFETDE